VKVVVHSKKEVAHITAVEELASMCTEIATRNVGKCDIDEIQTNVN
jgi:hypothetical protein